MAILSVVCAVIFLFLTVHNFSSGMECKAYTRGERGKVLYVMEDKRTWIKIARVFCFLLILGTIALYVYDVTHVERFSDVDGMQPLSLVAALSLFAFAPFSTSRWVMTENGIYVYNSGSFVPWSQMITTGITHHKKNTYLVVQIKKEKGEIFKQAFTMLMVPESDVENLNTTVREFIHAVDKMKLLKHIKDEKEDQKKRKKNLWY